MIDWWLLALFVFCAILGWIAFMTVDNNDKHVEADDPDGVWSDEWNEWNNESRKEI